MADNLPEEYATQRSCSEHSFWDIFSFCDMEWGGLDQCIQFDLIEILEDIPALGLKKGETFEHVYWDIADGTFEFVNFEAPNDWNNGFVLVKQLLLSLTQRKIRLKS